MDPQSANKAHRPKSSGPKKLKKNPVSSEKGNPKAFSIQHPTKAIRMVQRTLDHQTNKYHLPTSVCAASVPPPLVVALFGPPKSGKSTLMRSLIRHFGRQNISNTVGPVTIVASKKCRLTFFECGCDINSMIDMSKVADIVLLLVNVRIGLELYHMEFINLIQTHGMPRVIPILNHLDTFKDNSSTRIIRKKIKQRLWVDLNAKIFMLTKFQPKKYHKAILQASNSNSEIYGDYLLAEVRRLARLIIVKVPRPTDWRNSHPYFLIDRLEDVSAEFANEAQDPNSCHAGLYGYVRGASLRPPPGGPRLHIAGCNDFSLLLAIPQADPCPTLNQVVSYDQRSAFGVPSQEATARKFVKHLSERDRKIYAPMSNIGGVLFDHDATYIDLGGSHHLSNSSRLTGSTGQNTHFQQSGLTRAMTVELEKAHFIIPGLQENLEDHSIQMLSGAPLISSRASLDSLSSASDDSLSLIHDSEDSEEEAEHFSAKEDGDEKINIEREKMDIDESDTNFDSEPEAGIEIFSGVVSKEDCFETTQPISTNVNSTKKSVPYGHLKQMFDNIDWTRFGKAERVNWGHLIYSDSANDIIGGTLTGSTRTCNEIEDVVSGGLLIRSGSQSSTTVENPHNPLKPASFLNGYNVYGDDVTMPLSKDLANLLSSSTNHLIGKDSVVGNSTGAPAFESWCQADRKILIADLFTTGVWAPDEDFNSILAADSRAREEMESRQQEQTNMKLSRHKLNGNSDSEDGDDDDDEDSEEEDTDNEANEDGVFLRDTLGRRRGIKKVRFDEDSDYDSAKDEDDIIDENEDSPEVEDPAKDYEKRLLVPTKRARLAEKRARHRQLYDQLMTSASGGDTATAFHDTLVKQQSVQEEINASVRRRLLQEAGVKLDTMQEISETQSGSNPATDIEGLPPGTYVKLIFANLPRAFLTHFDPRQPLLIGGLSLAEETPTYLHSRFRAHRWLGLPACKINLSNGRPSALIKQRSGSQSHPPQLRSLDPITVSVGWRRYQSLAIFYKEEHNLRRRFLKYSLDHDSCNMIFYGPAVPPKTGLIAFSPSAWRDSGPIGDVFRVTGTGSILETSAHCDVVKKLKLVGEPYRVFRKTVFIRGMFTSALEVSRMIGAKIETVSKIRGIIKAALVNSADGAKPGDFRATFEAPICKADLVFLRSFVMVELPPYYNPISNLLFPKDSEAITCHPNKPETSDNQTNESTQKGWRMMRTLGEMRRSMDLKKPVKKDSFYTPIERQPYISAPLRFSTSFVSSLPFKEKPRAPRSAGRVDPIARLRAPLLVPPSVDRSASVKHRRQQRSASDYVQHPSDDQESKLVSSRTALSRLRALHASWLAKKRRDTTVRVSRFKAKLDADAHSREQAAKAKRKAFFASGRGKGKRKS